MHDTCKDDTPHLERSAHEALEVGQVQEPALVAVVPQEKRPWVRTVKRRSHLHVVGIDVKKS